MKDRRTKTLSATVRNEEMRGQGHAKKMNDHDGENNINTFKTKTAQVAGMVLEKLRKRAQ